MSSRIWSNCLLFIGIVSASAAAIVWRFEEDSAFKKLEKLRGNYDFLISSNKGYLNKYEKTRSLLVLEKYATNHLSMYEPNGKK